MCLRQFLRPKQNLRIEGVGDCTTCITDASNKNCRMYVEILVVELEVENK